MEGVGALYGLPLKYFWVRDLILLLLMFLFFLFCFFYITLCVCARAGESEGLTDEELNQQVSV